MVDFQRAHREEREARKHFSLSVVRRGAETVETRVYTFRGPFVKRCILCDRRSERTAICPKCHLEHSALEAIARTQRRISENHKSLVDRTVLPMGVSWGSPEDVEGSSVSNWQPAVAGLVVGAIVSVLVLLLVHLTGSI